MFSILKRKKCAKICVRCVNRSSPIVEAGYCGSEGEKDNRSGSEIQNTTRIADYSDDQRKITDSCSAGAKQYLKTRIIGDRQTRTSILPRSV